MVRKGRRRSGKKLEPPLPEVKEELYLPKYFGVIKGGGYNKAEERREVVPGPMPRSDETPRAISGRQPLLQPAPFPRPAPEPEEVPLLVRAARYVSRQNKVEEEVPGPLPKMTEAPKAIKGRQPLLQPAPFPRPAPEPEKLPLLIRAARYIGAILRVEPERPVRMPVVPELNFPALYTRFPLMKTVTKMTDAAGEICVAYSQSFKTVPGVIITVKDPDNVFGTVFLTALAGFKVRLFKMDHNHGGTVDTGGAHTPTINADGNHAHNVQGTGTLSLDTNYGWLSMSKYSDYEKDHIHTNPSTGGNNQSHTHTVPVTDGPSAVADAVLGVTWDEWCVACNYWLVTAQDFDSFATGSHYHPNTNKVTGGISQGHTHTQGNTGKAVNVLGHRHLISDDLLYNHYVYDVGLTLDLVATKEENPYHAHSGESIDPHTHVVPEDGRVLLKNTNVTITYLAQEE